MAESGVECDQIARAVAGDRAALEGLLLDCHDRLTAAVADGMPAELRRTASAEDILQEVYIDAFRRIGDFEPRGRGPFFAWLLAITRHKLLDAVKAHRAVRRGGGQAPIRCTTDSVIGLLEQLARHDHTPSRVAATHEAEAALRVALAELKDDYRKALQLRYLQGLSVAETAAAMGRTPRAIHMLCHRGLKELHVILGRASKFFSKIE